MTRLIDDKQIILSGVVGSNAYGLNTPESDTDIRGIFVEPLKNILSLDKYRDVLDYNEPDECYYELAKFLLLALNANPNILELLYLDYPQGYTKLTGLGDYLIGHRDKFLSNKIRLTYGGYAKSQFDRLIKRNDGTFSSNTRNRYEKHSRHMMRLLHQGRELLETGTLTVRVSDPEYYFRAGRLEPDKLTKLFNKEFEIFNKASSCLPDMPDKDWANEMLLWARLGAYNDQ